MGDGHRPTVVLGWNICLGFRPVVAVQCPTGVPGARPGKAGTVAEEANEKIDFVSR